MARPEGFEPPTPTFVALYSIQLSYGRALPRNFGGRDLTTSDFSHKLEPPCEEQLAAADQAVRTEAADREDQSPDPRRHAPGEVWRNRRHRRHPVQGKAEGDENATQEIKEIPCATRRRILSHSSM
jgi:hypothetical protein